MTTGPYVFIAEVPADKQPRTQLVLKVPDADALWLDPAVEVVTPFLLYEVPMHRRIGYGSTGTPLFSPHRCGVVP